MTWRWWLRHRQHSLVREGSSGRGSGRHRCLPGPRSASLSLPRSCSGSTRRVFLTSLGDTDDATRMIEVREWMAGASWFDLTLPRFGGAYPLVSHWSRLIDVPLALLLSGFEFSLPADEAELVVRALWPLLVFWAFVYLLAREAEIRGGRIGGAVEHSAHRDVHHRHRAVPVRPHRPPQRDDPLRGHRHPALGAQLR